MPQCSVCVMQTGRPPLHVCRMTVFPPLITPYTVTVSCQTLPCWARCPCLGRLQPPPPPSRQVSVSRPGFPPWRRALSSSTPPVHRSPLASRPGIVTTTGGSLRLPGTAKLPACGRETGEGEDGNPFPSLPFPIAAYRRPTSALYKYHEQATAHARFSSCSYPPAPRGSDASTCSVADPHVG